MSWTIILTLIILGLLALILEIFLIPGGVVGVLGLVTIVVGIVFAYISKGAQAGSITLLVTAIVTIALTILMLRSRTWKKCALDAQIDTKMNEIDSQKVHAGSVGHTISRLAPTGKAVFDGEAVEVVSEFGLIDEDCEVVVEKIEGNRVFVKRKSE